MSAFRKYPDRVTTCLTLSGSTLARAKAKAAREKVSVSETVNRFLSDWVDGSKPAPSQRQASAPAATETHVEYDPS